jgi:hypothetical protein
MQKKGKIYKLKIISMGKYKIIFKKINYFIFDLRNYKVIRIFFQYL